MKNQLNNRGLKGDPIPAQLREQYNKAWALIEPKKHKRRNLIKPTFREPVKWHDEKELSSPFGLSPAAKRWNKLSFEEQKKVKYQALFKERLKKLQNSEINDSEKALFNILEELYPGEWRFVGDGSFFIGKLCPDFINTNGKKLVIELFGEAWHKGNIDWKRTELGRMMAFSVFGFRTLIIWCKELKDKEAIGKKIKRFLK